MIDIVTTKNRFLEMAIRGELVSHTGNAEQIDVILTNIENQYKKLKKNKETKISKIAEMQSDCLFSIPDNWKWVPLGKVCIMLSRGKSPKYSENKKIPVFAQKCNQPNELALWKARFLDETTLDKWPEYFRLRDGDIVINSTGTGTVGRIGYYLSETLEPQYPFMLPDSHVTVARIGEGVISKYIYYVLRSPSLQNIMEKNFRGSTNQKEFYIDSVYSTPIPLPSTEEQNLIVNILDNLFEKLSVIEKLQNQYVYDFEVLKNKVIDAGIHGKLTEQLNEEGDAEELFNRIQNQKEFMIKEKRIKKEKALPQITEDEIPFDVPDNWKWVRLGEICSKISSGNTPAGGAKGGAYVDEGYCFFREQNIYNDGIHEEGMVYISEEVLNTRPNSTVLPDDILLNITGGSIGRCALVPDDFTKGSINQHILIIRTVDPKIRFYIHKCLCSPYYQKLIMGNVVGDKDGFSAGRCKNTLIPLPPLKEQERIVERIDGLLAAIG